MKPSRLAILGLILASASVVVGPILLRSTSKSTAPAKLEPDSSIEAPLSPSGTEAKKLPLLAQSSTASSPVATISFSGAPSVQLWTTPEETTGEKLDPKSAKYAKAESEGVKPKGRSSPFNRLSLTSLGTLQRGDNVVIPLLGGEQVAGKVNLVQQDKSGWVRVGGELTGARAGSFSLGSKGKSLGGTVLLAEEQIAYTIAEQSDGRVLMEEKHLSEVICFQMPRPKDEPVSARRSFGPQESPPILSSRPGATAVLYLDFDGETVTDTSWNSGNTIVAQPSSLTGTEITEAWNRVKEDYWPFNIDVTTSRNRYDNAPVGSRMRCIITPTSEWYGDLAGGVALRESFYKAGTWFSPTVPCWVFNDSGAKNVAEAVSHELGHTFGLHHDGRTSPVEDYYEGHGTGAVGWAPIMGAGYYKELVQWSKGEYAYANEHEDDLAIIAGVIGYITDEAGNSLNAAAPLSVFRGSVNQTGIISGNNDVDFYVFTIPAPTTVSLAANPASVSPNLDTLLELVNSAGVVLATANPDLALNAAINYPLPAGTYYIKVQGTGRGSVLADGYSKYGSIGYYSLSGTIPPGLPAITSDPASQTVPVGSDVTFSITASGAPPLYYGWLSNGYNLVYATNASYTITNVQTKHAAWYYGVVRNAAGSATSKPAVLDVGFPPSIKTQPTSKTVKAGANVTLTVTASGTTPLSYQWSVNGTSIAGATKSSFPITGAQPSQAGDYRVKVSNPYGAVDSAIATLTVQYAPVITQQPQSQNVKIGERVTLSVVAAAVPVASYQWKFNTVKVPGATASAYTIASFQQTNAGNYTVVVSNSLGSVTSSSAALAVAVCTPAPEGLVAWWPAEGESVDIVSGNNGTAMNGVSFAPGKVGQAFSFNGSASYIRVADNPSLHCTNALTIEAWVYPSSLGTYHNIVSKWGLIDALQTSYTTALVPDGRISLAVCASGDTSATPVVGTASTNSIAANQWTHFAATYDGLALRMYINGICESQVAYNQGIFPGTEALAIGAAGVFAGGEVLSPFAGLIDEVAVYNRALSASEIAGIYKAVSLGKCPLPPTFRTQPANQTVIAGDTATFSVAASGNTPLSYQWFFNGNPIPTASLASFTIPGVQADDTGNYSVTISNAVGHVTSATATLVVRVPSISARVLAQDPLVAGLVAYYPFDGSGNDESGNGNNATIVGTDWKYSTDRFGLQHSLYLNKASPPSYTFEGSYVMAPRSALLDFKKDFTLSAWVNIPDGLPVWFPQNLISNGADTSGANVRIVTDANASANGYLDYLQFIWGNGVPAYSEVAASLPRLRNTWWQVVVVRAGTNLSLFRGAQLVASSVALASASNNPAIWIGKHQAGTPYCLFGQIDDVRMYNRAFSPQEVVHLYQHEANPMLSTGTAAKTLRLTFTLAKGKTYQLESSADLRTWAPYGPPIIAADPSVTQDVDIFGTQQYFRLRLNP